MIRLTQTKCTFAEGLGGPPKWRRVNRKDLIVEVLPIIDSEGYFLRKDELESWDGLDVSALFAVYEAAQPDICLIKTIRQENTQSFSLARIKTQA